jgi:hypothetical protein
MNSWKEAQMVFICKKGDREDLKKWRPITITNSIYRICMCLMARAFQQMNLQYGIYIDAQKGFIEKTNGYSEHGILLDELFQDAKRKNNDLIVTAIDFSNAFDSVPHDLIMSTLKQLNLSIWTRVIIKDIYNKSKSKIEERGKHTGSIK